MSVNKFIGQTVSAAVQVTFSNDVKIAPTLIAKYEGEIASGNAVTVVGADLPTVQDYAAQGRRFTAEEIAATDVKLLIDREKIVANRVDDIDRRQAAGSLDPFTDGAGKALARDAERDILAEMITNGTEVSAAVIDTPAKAKAAVRKLMIALDDAEVPADGRYLAINSAGKDLLIDELSDVSKSGSTDELRKGVIGALYGFNVIHTTDFDKAITGAALVGYHEASAAFAAQIADSRAVPAHDGHADILSSLLVYGVKATRPSAIAVHVSGGAPAGE